MLIHTVTQHTMLHHIVTVTTHTLNQLTALHIMQVVLIQHKQDVAEFIISLKVILKE